jgi:hypothetical protein
MFLQIAVCAGIFAKNFDDIFPDAGTTMREAAFSEEGYYNTLARQSDNSYAWTIHPVEDLVNDAAKDEVKYSGKNIAGKLPSYILETLMVLPHKNGERRTLLDIYNALGRTRALEGRMYHSFSRGKIVPLFTKVSRIDDLKTKRAIDDPPQAQSIPQNEKILFRVQDINFGACYYRSELDSRASSISYTLSNIENISFLIFSVIKKENLNIHFSIEALDEGILIYALTGIEVESFAGSHVDVPSAAKKRFDVIKGWIVDGING